MKKQIKEIQDYFKNKIVNGDYEITDFQEHYSTIDIKGYLFDIWTSNGKNDISHWTSNYKVNSPVFLGEFSGEQKEIIWNQIYPKIEAKKADDLKTAKLDAFNKMKEELEKAGLI